MDDKESSELPLKVAFALAFLFFILGLLRPLVLRPASAKERPIPCAR